MTSQMWAQIVIGILTLALSGDLEGQSRLTGFWSATRSFSRICFAVGTSVNFVLMLASHHHTQGRPRGRQRNKDPGGMMWHDRTLSGDTCWAVTDYGCGHS
jgi:hypothetical protein